MGGDKVGPRETWEPFLVYSRPHSCSPLSVPHRPSEDCLFLRVLAVIPHIARSMDTTLQCLLRSPLSPTATFQGECWAASPLGELH